jgi:mannose-6-phosphate isomerase
MANSDNVLRGGLTTKHVDVAQLLSVLAFEGAPVRKLHPEAVGDSCQRYVTPAREFELWKHELGAEPTRMPASDGPEIVIAVEGKARYRTEESLVELLPGESAFVPPTATGYELAGPALVYRALVPRSEGTGFRGLG